MQTHKKVLEAYFPVETVCAAVWQTTDNEQGRITRKVHLESLYKDNQGEWQFAKGLNTQDIPKAIIALQQAYKYLNRTSYSINPQNGWR